MPNKVNNILDSRFRANPNYEMVLYDRLPPEYQQTWQSLLNDPDFYGVLWPRENHAKQIKAVDQQTALLFFTLHQPGAIPTYVQKKLGDRCNQIIAELVLDGVLEIAADEQEEFISGPGAHKHIYQSTNLELGRGHIAQLSFEALRYAQKLSYENSSVISSKLYFYNTIPVSPSWRRRLPEPDAVLSYLAIDKPGVNQSTLAKYWRRAKLGQGRILF